MVVDDAECTLCFVLGWRRSGIDFVIMP
jgi:hypothetical protein